MKINNFTLRVLTSLSLILILSFAWFGPLKQAMFFLVSFFLSVLILEYYKLSFLKEFSYKSFFKKSFYLFIFLSFIFYLLFISLLFLNISADFFLKKFFLFFEQSLFFLYIFLIFCFWRFYLNHPLRKQKKALSDKFSAKHIKPVIALSEKKSFWLFFFLSLLYITFPASLFLNVFYRGESTKEVLLLILSLVFLGDILAYIGGKTFKGKKWVPLLSPGKTWSGLLSGLSGSAFLSGFGFSQILGHFSLFPLFFFVGAFAFFIAQTGDLFVSLLKRRAGLKDSGSFLPGHGGLLDRLDGFLLAFPCLYLLINIFF